MDKGAYKLSVSRKKTGLGAILLALCFWPFIVVGYVIKWLSKNSQQKQSRPKTNITKSDESIVSQSSSLVTLDNGGLVESMLIPDPTRSLLFITDEDTSNIQYVGSIRLTLDINSGHVKREENGYFAEPSLIWKKLPVRPNTWLEEKAMYYPAYSQFSPEHRYQYLRWLKDIEQPTNLSYVFLYFYGLERHLLVGDYDAAVDEILRLIKFHKKSSFRAYASSSLIVASIFRKRLDITERAPFLLEEEVDEALALRIVKGTSMSPDDMISIASRVGFTNKRYVKLHPERFKHHLQAVIDEFEAKYGKVLSMFKIEDFKQVNSNVFANMSIPERARLTKVPQILEDKKFQTAIFNALKEAHLRVKNELSSKPKKTRA